MQYEILLAMIDILVPVAVGFGIGVKINDND